MSGSRSPPRDSSPRRSHSARGGGDYLDVSVAGDLGPWSKLEVAVSERRERQTARNDLNPNANERSFCGDTPRAKNAIL